MHFGDRPGETRLIMMGGPQDGRFKPTRKLRATRERDYPVGIIPRLRGCVTPELLIHSHFLPTAIGDAFRLWQEARPERLILLMRPGWKLRAGTDVEIDRLCRYL